MTKTLILYATQVPDAVDEIRGLNGRVTQHLATNILLATVAKDFNVRLLKFSTTEIPRDLDEDTSLVVKAWRHVGSHLATKTNETKVLNKGAPKHLQQSSENGKIHDMAMEARPETLVCNDKLAGPVAIGLVMVSVGEDKFNFSKSDILKTIGQVAGGAEILAESQMKLDTGTTFFYDRHIVKLLGDHQAPTCRMSASPSAVEFQGKIYVFYQGSGNNGQLWYSTYDGNSWAANQIQVPGSRLSSSPSAVVYQGQLYCFHQGAGNSGNLWYNVFDGTNWLGEMQVQNTFLSSGPSAVVFQGLLYCFHQGSGNNGQLWYNVYNGGYWTGDKQVFPACTLSSKPSAVVYDEKLYCFYQGSKNSGQLWYTIFDGTTWAAQINVSGTGISSGPSCVVGNSPGGDECLHCFHQGSGNDGLLCLTTLQDGSWDLDFRCGTSDLSSSPSALIFKDDLYCFYQGKGNSGNLWYDNFSSWDLEPRGQIYEKYEGLWRDPALKQLGYSPGYKGCLEFADALCRKYKTTRAYIVFVTKFPQPCFAYTSRSSVRICIQYENDGWGPERIGKTFESMSRVIYGEGD